MNIICYTFVSHGFTFDLVTQNTGKNGFLFTAEFLMSTLVLWLSNLLSINGHSVSVDVSRLSDILFTATGTDNMD